MDLLQLNERDIEEFTFNYRDFSNIFEKGEAHFNTNLGFSDSKYGSYYLDAHRYGNTYLAKTKCYFHQNIQARGEGGISNIAIYFTGNGNGMFDNTFGQIPIKNNTHNVLFMREEYNGEGVYLKERKFDATSLHLPIPYFEDLVKKYPEIFESHYIRYQKGKSFYVNEEYTPTSAQMYHLLFQLENSYMMGVGRELYSDSKVMEILSHVFQVQAGKEMTSCHCKTKSDYDRIHEAAFLLLSDIHKPPTIHDLSLKVGVNEKKLKYGFKEVFGTTVYGYLFEHKMNLAKQMLLETTKSIGEIAVMCGYDYISHFSTAFKRRYGYSPNKARR